MQLKRTAKLSNVIGLNKLHFNKLMIQYRVNDATFYEESDEEVTKSSVN